MPTVFLKMRVSTYSLVAQKVNLVGFDQDFKKETELNKLENIRVTHSRGSIAF